MWPHLICWWFIFGSQDGPCVNTRSNYKLFSFHIYFLFKFLNVRQKIFTKKKKKSFIIIPKYKLPFWSMQMLFTQITMAKWWNHNSWQINNSLQNFAREIHGDKRHTCWLFRNVYDRNFHIVGGYVLNFSFNKCTEWVGS